MIGSALARSVTARAFRRDVGLGESKSTLLLLHRPRFVPWITDDVRQYAAENDSASRAVAVIQDTGYGESGGNIHGTCKR
jgi:hypothetical protein